MRLAAVQELGDAVGDAWRARQYDDDAFPEIASAALAAAPLGSCDLGSLVLATLERSDLVRSNATPHAFGDLSVKLYQAADFHIELLVWADGLTDIHEHAFAGALRVVAGSSVHCTYDFEEREGLGGRIRIGEVRLRRTELLRCGDVRPIVPGHLGLVHSLFHLARPSVTVVVRTEPLPRHQPQYSLRPPAFAIDAVGLAADPEVRLASRVLSTLATVDWPAAYALLRELLGRMDFPRAVTILERGLGFFADEPGRRGQLDELLDAMADRFGSLADSLRPMCDFGIRLAEIAGLRRRVPDPDLRFFLALLLNVPSRSSLDRLIEESYPGRPAEDTLVTWLCHLFDRRVLGCALRGEDAERYLRSILRGESAEQMIASLKGEFDPRDVETQREALTDIHGRITSLPVLKALLAA